MIDEQTIQLAATYPLVIVPENEKGPRKKGWADSRPSPEQVRRALDRGCNVGLVLGARSGIIDVECDSAEAEAALRKLVGDDVLDFSPCWQSKRGRHYLFLHDMRLAAIVSVKKHLGIEFRIGNSEMVQSLLPPSQVDGIAREWIKHLAEHDPQPLPEHVIELLVSLGSETSDIFDSGDDPLFSEAFRAAQTRKRSKLQDYLARNNLSITNINSDHHGRIAIHFAPCPFKPPGHTDGDPWIIVNRDGSHGFKCLHASCADKSWDDIEDFYGPLSPIIRIDADLERMTTEAIRALASDPTVFQRGLLTQVAHNAPPPPQCLVDNGAPRLVPVERPTLALLLSSAARWEKRTGKRCKPCLPPSSVVAAVEKSISYPGIPVITSVVSSPILRPDGSIVSSPGYDKATGVYLDTQGTYPPLMRPTEAVAELLDVICDFPFLTDAHRSGWIAQLITLLSRSAIAGSTPLFFTDANSSGAGKGLSTDITTTIFEGRQASRYPSPKADDEMRKAITTVAISGSPYILFDNVKSTFGGEALEGAMTAGRWFDRVLKFNTSVDLPLAITWMATGNNATLTADMIRRVCHIRMESPLEKPAERTGFKHSDLLKHVKQNRHRLAIAALSIPAAYIKAGKPSQGLTPWGGFEAWSDLVRSSIVWAGCADPGDTRAALADQADDESSLLRRLVAGWSELGTLPLTVAAALDMLQSAPGNQFPTMREVVAELSGDHRKALGQMLRDSRRRVIAGRFFDRTDSKTPKWSLVSA